RHASLALSASFNDWVWAAAEREFRRSLELNPENAIAHRTYGVFLAAIGKTHDALRETQRAAELDPLSALTAHFPGLVLCFSRRYDEAIEVFKKALEIDPHFPGSYAGLASSYQLKGQLAEAIAWAEKPAFLAKLAAMLSLRGFLYALAGRHTDAMHMMDELNELSKNQYVSPYHFFIIHFGLGDLNAWRKAAWEAYEEHSNSVAFFKVFSAFDPIRSDALFQEIMRRVGLS